MSEKRIGIVGCGGISAVHAQAICQISGATLVAVCDIVREKAEALAQKAEAFGLKEVLNGKRESMELPGIYESLEEMLKQERLDVLHICTPHYLHVPMAITALQHGVSVLCEKPPAITIEQWEQLKEVQEQSRKYLGFCFQNRYNLSTARLDRLVESRVLGKVLGARAMVTWKRDYDYYEGSLWKGKLATEGGGALINQSIHTLDLLLRYLGEPERVEASVHNHHTSREIQVEDTVEAWLSFPENRRACFYASTAYVTDAPNLLELQCEKGRITLLGSNVILDCREEVSRESYEEPVTAGKDYWGAGHLACIKDFYHAIDTKGPFQNDLKGVENTLLTTMRIYENRQNI